MQDEKKTDLQLAGIAGTLQERLALFNVKHAFKPEQLVQWKPGMAHKRSAGPFIVVDVLAEPLVDTDRDAGSPYFQEPLDIVCAEMREDSNDFIAYHYDKRRFEPYSGPMPSDI